MRNQSSCKVVYKELQSVNTSKTGCIAFLPVCTLAYRKWDQRAKGELNEVISGLFICPGVPPAQGVKALKLLLLCSLFASDGCVKSGGGVFGTVCVCLEAEAKEGGGFLMNRETGLLLCSPRCWSFPSCFACPLTELFMALGLVPDLSHTCQQQQVFLSILRYHHFPTSTVPHKTAW